MGSSSEAEGLEVEAVEEVEDAGFEESLPFDAEAEFPLAEPEFAAPDDVDPPEGDPEGEVDVLDGEGDVVVGDEVEGDDPVEFGEAGGELLAVVEVGLDDFDSSLSAAPSLRRCSTGRPLPLSSSSMTGGAYFLVLVCIFAPSGNQVPSAIQL